MIPRLTALMLLLSLAPLSANAAGLRTVTMTPLGKKGPDQTVTRLLIDRDLKLVQIVLRKGKTMDRHEVDEPVTIHCVAGRGVLINADGSRTALEPGVVAVLAPNLSHAIQATPEISLLLTRFAKPSSPTSNRLEGEPGHERVTDADWSGDCPFDISARLFGGRVVPRPLRVPDPASRQPRDRHRGA